MSTFVSANFGELFYLEVVAAVEMEENLAMVRIVFYLPFF